MNKSPDSMRIDLAKLKAVAEKATRGPWMLNTNYFDESWVANAAGTVLIGETKADNEHIANCDPQTIFALIEAVRERDRVREFVMKSKVWRQQQYEALIGVSDDWIRGYLAAVDSVAGIFAEDDE